MSFHNTSAGSQGDAKSIHTAGDWLTEVFEGGSGFTTTGPATDATKGNGAIRVSNRGGRIQAHVYGPAASHASGHTVPDRTDTLGCSGYKRPTVEDDQDSEGSVNVCGETLDTASSGDDTPPESPVRKEPEDLAGLPNTSPDTYFSVADVQAYEIAAAWLEAYQEGNLHPAFGEMKDLRDIRASILEGKLSDYDTLTAETGKIPINQSLCAGIRKRITEAAQLDRRCVEREQEIWANYINISATVWAERYVDVFIAERRICKISPSSDSDKLVDIVLKELTAGSPAAERVQTLLCHHRDGNWELESS